MIGRGNKVLVSMVALLVGSGLCAAQAGKPVRIPKPVESQALTEAQAKQFIQQRTLIQACGDPAYHFQTVEIGRTDRRKIQERWFVLYPVHARYTVDCRYGDDRMQAEVDLKTEGYLDDFNKWVLIDPGFEQDQDWQSATNGVRCHVKGVSHLTVDKAGNVTGSAPFKDQGYMGCTVMAKNGD